MIFPLEIRFLKNTDLNRCHYNFGVTQRRKTRLTILEIAYSQLKNDTILKEIEENLRLKVHKNIFVQFFFTHTLQCIWKRKSDFKKL